MMHSLHATVSCCRVQLVLLIFIAILILFESTDFLCSAHIKSNLHSVPVRLGRVGKRLPSLQRLPSLWSSRRRKTINDELQDGSATHVLEEEPPYYVEQLHWTEHSRSEKC